MLPQPQALDKREVHSAAKQAFHGGMKYLLAVLAGALFAGAHASPPPRPASDLRHVLQQVKSGGGTATRQLSAEDRAELRRQVQEAAQPRPRKR